MNSNLFHQGWYSTGVYYWSKSIVEIIPIIITILCFSYVVDIYDSKNSMLFEYMIFLTIGALEVQSISHVLGILASDNIRVGVFTLVGVIMISFMFSNILIPIKELHYSLQVFSNLATLKLLIESLMILFYGLDRCSDREFSYILSILNIEDKDLYMNIYLLIAQFFLFRAIALLILMYKANSNINYKKDQEYKEVITELIVKRENVTKICNNLFI